jgi:hemolysin III
MFLLYMASTLYHAIRHPKARHVFKVIDHAGIYLLIAGTYTPFTLVTIRDQGGWWLFAVVWALALVGISLEAYWV